MSHQAWLLPFSELWFTHDIIHSFVKWFYFHLTLFVYILLDRVSVELLVLLPLHTRCWNYKHVSPYPVKSKLVRFFVWLTGWFYFGCLVVVVVLVVVLVFCC